ncbi:hypothetical protein RND71_016420 [Anisodus tanguticus]|uniref:Uncharacterized protein n=1 Tax=Anisodus tanguticus TaxID=243964 RepID=A0AAE1VDR8_9SOLA|nr:hypothetical protein RND71_016420 [Anisodus tanguticus]
MTRAKSMRTRQAEEQLRKIEAHIQANKRPRWVEINPNGAGNENGNGTEFHPKLQFPNYNGVEPRAWLRRSDRYFNIYRITDAIKKLEMATLHLEGYVKALYFSFTSLEDK